jgi:hypothetical protein
MTVVFGVALPVGEATELLLKREDDCFYYTNITIDGACR